MQPSVYFITSLFISLSILLITIYPIREKMSENFYLRIQSWWWMVLVLTIFVYLGPNFMPLLIGFIGLHSVKEVWKAKMNNSAVTRTSSWLTLGLIALITTLILSLTFLTFYLPNSVSLGYVVYLIFATQSSDILQYFCGKKWGKRSLLPQISPNKTCEGAIGGVLISSVLSSCVGLYLTEMVWWQSWCVSIVLATLGIIGDLYVSWFKRRVQIKDMGGLIPGHGGMLDRVDSLLFAAPCFCLLGVLGIR